jgi:hypothetical protein
VDPRTVRRRGPHARLRKRPHRLTQPSAPGKTTPPAPAGGVCPATATVGPFFPAKPASGGCDRSARCALATAAKKNRKPCLTRADVGAEFLSVSVLELGWSPSGYETATNATNFILPGSVIGRLVAITPTNAIET